MAFFKARVLWWWTAVAAPIPPEWTLAPGVNRKKQESEQQDAERCTSCQAK